MPVGINDLPTDVIGNIFMLFKNSQFPILSRICKKWNATTKTPSIWRHMLKTHFNIEVEDRSVSPKILFEKVWNLAQANPINVLLIGNDIQTLTTLWLSVNALGINGEETLKNAKHVGVDNQSGSHNGFKITVTHNPKLERSFRQKIDNQYIVCCPNTDEEVTKAAVLKALININKNGNLKGTILIVVLPPESNLAIDESLTQNYVVLSQKLIDQNDKFSVAAAKQFYHRLTQISMSNLFVQSVKERLLRDSRIPSPIPANPPESTTEKRCTY